MALIEIRADLSRVAKALERIAKVLERAVPEPNKDVEPSTEEDFHQVGYALNPMKEDELWTLYGPRRNY